MQVEKASFYLKFIDGVVELKENQLFFVYLKPLPKNKYFLI